MSQQTTNLQLNTWNQNDVVDFEQMNDNFEKIDNFAGKHIWKTIYNTAAQNAEYFRGNVTVSLPSDFEEISVKVNLDNLGKILVLRILKLEMYETTTQEFRVGYFLNGDSGSGGAACFNVSQQTIQLINAWVNGATASVTEDTYWAIHYR